MALELGIPESAARSALRRRLAWVGAARLGVLMAMLALVGFVYLRADPTLESPSMRLALGTLGVAFALSAAGSYALRRGLGPERLATLQLVGDQLLWTVLVYLTGGAASGATSFYGLTCLLGASLTGLRGAAVAAVAGGASFLSLVAALAFGELGPPEDQPARLYALPRNELLWYVTVNLVALVVVTLLAGWLAERLRRAGGELVRAEARAVEAERLAALGQVAAGLAHEIRNPLSSISGSIRLLASAPGLGAEDRKLCEIIEREAARLDDLVGDMMDLARPRPPSLARVDAAVVAREVGRLAGTHGRAVSDVAVIVEGLERAPVRADAAQLRQLLWNLVRNAVQASPPGTAVRVRMRLVGEDVVLEVSDQGPGIGPEARERLFDAFYTTRAQGTGIGLAVVKRIADAHGFRVEVESDGGATFRVTLGKPEGSGDVASSGAAPGPAHGPGEV